MPKKIRKKRVARAKPVKRKKGKIKHPKASRKTSRRPGPLPVKKSAVSLQVRSGNLKAGPPFLTPSAPPDDLPFSYGETTMVLLVRDPYWAYSYWDFSGETWGWIQQKLSGDFSLKPMIRVHDLDQKHFYELLVSLEVKNWYLHLGVPDHRFVAELGLGDGKGRFLLIARSNEVRTPRDKPSEEIDSDWQDRNFEETYRLSGGGQPGLSSPGSLHFPRRA